MRWVFWPNDERAKAEAFRRVHERCLSQAMRRPERLPRIPIRAVSHGGFSGLIASPAGRRAIERWWERVLSAPDLDMQSE